MSKVRVLVGTRKGAFILASDGKREKWDVSGPHFAGLGDVPHQGIARRSESDVCIAVQRLVRAVDPALERRRQDLGAGGQQVRVRRRPRHASVVRRHAAPLGIQARLASGAVAHRSGHGLRRSGRRRHVPHHRRRQVLARACPDCAATAPGPAGSRAPAGWACTPSFWIRAIPSASTSPSRPRAPSAPTTAAQPGSRSTAG